MKVVAFLLWSDKILDISVLADKKTTTLFHPEQLDFWTRYAQNIVKATK